jgi:hypothetical protein
MVDVKLRRLTRPVVAGVAILCLLASAPGASAHHRDHRDRHRLVAARGHCSEDSVWRLVLVQKGPNVIVVGFAVRSGVADDLWRVQLSHGRHPFFLDLVKTNGDGWFGIRRPTRNTPGLDLYRARARNVETGELCVARLAV